MQFFNSNVVSRNWIGFYIFVILAWFLNLYMSFGMNELSSLTNFYGADFWQTMCRTPSGFFDWPGLFFMWGLMGAAMMAPTLYPALQTYNDLIYSGGAPWIGFWILLIGFLLVWLGFAGIASLGQVWLSENKLLTSSGAISHPFGRGVLLILAALYQFTPIKSDCLSRCRTPMTFFLESWSLTGISIFWIGIRMGAICVGCCWALMLLGFVGGTMNVLLMGAATVFMVVEKLPEVGRYVSKPIAILLLVFGFLYMWDALTLFRGGSI